MKTLKKLELMKKKQYVSLRFGNLPKLGFVGAFLSGVGRLLLLWMQIPELETNKGTRTHRPH